MFLHYSSSQVRSIPASPLTERACRRWWMAIFKTGRCHCPCWPTAPPSKKVLYTFDVQLYVTLCSASWRTPNSNPFAPSLIPSVWPPKVTSGHRPFMEGCLIASPLQMSQTSSWWVTVNELHEQFSCVVHSFDIF